MAGYLISYSETGVLKIAASFMYRFPNIYRFETITGKEVRIHYVKCIPKKKKIHPGKFCSRHNLPDYFLKCPLAEWNRFLLRSLFTF